MTLQLHKTVATLLKDALKNNKGYKYKASTSNNNLLYTLLIPNNKLKGYNKPLNCYHNLNYKKVIVNITFPFNGILLKVYKK